MFKENKCKSLEDHCSFTSAPLVELYKRLCSLDPPYVWIKCGDRGEKLCYIDDIQTFEGVVSGYSNAGGWELPVSCDDIISLHLVRIRNDKKCETEQKIVLSRTTSENVEFTAEKLMQNAGIRIPTKQELCSAEYEHGIPGHITTNEEKVFKLKAEVEAYEKEIMSHRIQNEICAALIGELTCKIEGNDRKINCKKKWVNDALLEINKLI